MNEIKTKKIKVCQVTTIPFAIRFLLLNQIKDLQKQGYNVSVVCSPGKWVKEIEEEGVPVKTIKITRRMSPFSDLITLFKLIFYFRKEKFDIVHTSMPKPGLLGTLAARMAGVAIVIHSNLGFYFQKDIRKVTKKWTFKTKEISLEYYLSGEENPGYSGNYIFTKESWLRAGGYPEGVWLGSWGFGFRQLATGSKMMIMPNSYYYHRCGHESNWIRKYREGKTSLTALQVLIPFLGLINKEDLDYIMSPKGRYVWFSRLKEHPLRLAGKPVRKINFYKKSKAKINRLFRNLRIQNIPKLLEFYKSYKKYKYLDEAGGLKLSNLYPRLNDNTPTSSFDPHYFYQGVWAFRKIKENKPENHVDVGSEIKWVGLLSTIVKVIFIDIRPLRANLKNLITKKGNILNIPLEDNSVSSLSCLHVAEHIGLGRYGDHLDPLGTEKACKELKRCSGTQFDPLVVNAFLKLQANSN